MTADSLAHSGGSDLAAADDEAFALRMLPLVSRSFALTIPQLPGGLRGVVTNAYLLCRLADTVEDDPAMSVEHKDELHALLLKSLEDNSVSAEFRERIVALLSDAMPAAERELASGAEHVLRETHRLRERQRQTVRRCLSIMCRGMARFERRHSTRGLRTLAEMKDYCYVVAGVVGEMLTDLFCQHSTQIESQRSQLMPRAVAFGRGLQMTNILKDVWEDRAAQRCWLPQDVFLARGVNLEELAPGRSSPHFEAGLNELIGITHGYLRDALAYTQAIPKHERGIRKFCLWSIGLAALTLRKIQQHPDYATAGEVKVSRRAVRLTVMASAVAARSNRMALRVFDYFARGLPLIEPAPERRLSGP